jgi:hypothetical protein
VNRFTEHSQVVTTNNYNSLAGIHTRKRAPTAHKIKSSFLVTNLSSLTLNYNDDCLTNELVDDSSTNESRQSQSYFTTGGLPPISSSWRQAP